MTFLSFIFFSSLKASFDFIKPFTHLDEFYLVPKQNGLTFALLFFSTFLINGFFMVFSLNFFNLYLN
jgi:hypothetical protein